MTVAVQQSAQPSGSSASLPRLGFAGVGWIGLHRMRAILESGHGTAAAICDPADAARALAAREAPDAVLTGTFEELLERDLDGIVIATPSALHASQAIAALEKGMPVFCQKPLARTAGEARAVVAAARAADRLLAVDMSYRHTRAMVAVRDLIQRGELGAVFAADLVFHNAYGPDREWFHERLLSGGGCMMDLGVHLVDLALWVLGFPRVSGTTASLYAQGKLLSVDTDVVEDYATAELRLVTGTSVRITCSWNVAVGADAVIAAQFHGTRGGAAFRNVNGSFYDFEALRFSGTQTESVVTPPDDWGGRAAVAWAAHLARNPGFDPEVDQAVDVAAVIDSVYGR
jgi:predicted dehydrogenase